MIKTKITIVICNMKKRAKQIIDNEREEKEKIHLPD